MRPHEPSRAVERGIRILVRCYPPPVRDAFGEDITMTFRDAYRDRVGGPLSLVRFWGRALWEGLATIPTAWWEWWTGHQSRFVLGGRRPGRGSRGPRRNRGSGDAPANEPRFAGSSRFMEGVTHDVRIAIRVAARTPLVTGLAITALALGIGANTVVFSLAEAVLLPGTEIPEADRVVQVRTLHEGRQVSHVPDRYFTYRDETTAFERFEAFYFDVYLLEGMLRRTMTLVASDGLFELLGAETFLGRTLSPSPEVSRAPAGVNSEMMLTYDFWLEHFGGDSTVVGQTVRFGERDRMMNPQAMDLVSRTIVGVLRPGFELPPHQSTAGLGTGPEGLGAVIPLSEGMWDRDRRAFNFYTLARLVEGASPVTARSQLEAVSTGIGEAHPDEVGYVPLVAPLTALPSEAYGRAMTLLWAVVVSVLLIACLNVAALLLARTTTRDAEFAIRASLGAGRGRVARQLLTEGLLLAAAGATVGVGLAYWGIGASVALFPSPVLGLSEAGINSLVLGATVLLTMTTVLLFGWAPLVVASRSDLSSTLKASGRAPSLAPDRILRSLVAVEVALALGLFGGGSLLVGSFLRLTQVELGVNDENLLVLDFDIPDSQISKYGDGEGRISLVGFYERVFRSVEEVPGVQRVALAAGAGYGLPLTDSRATPLTVEDRPRPGREEALRAVWSLVGAEYFDVIGTPVLAGRGFADDEEVAVVSEAAARQFWPGQDPVGKRFTYGWQDLENGRNDPRYREPALISVVGVVGDVMTSDLRGGAPATVYIPFRGVGGRSAKLIVRTSLPPESVAAAVRAAVLAVDEVEIQVSSVSTSEDLFSKAVAEPRFNAFLMGLLSLTALVLVAAAVYGVLAYSVRRRIGELSIRIVLGARRSELLAMVLRQGMAPVFVGVAAGAMLVPVLGWVMREYMFEVSAFEPATVAVCSVFVIGLAALACYMPARRVSDVNPMSSLRTE